MRRAAWCMMLLLLQAMVVSAQEDTLQQRIVLIGDAGQFYKGHHPVVDAVRKTIPLNSKTTVLYLGDNLYKTGLPDEQLPTYEIAKAVLDTQISLTDKTKAKTFFIPGNHDWAGGGVNGLESIIRQQIYVEKLGSEHENPVKYLPQDGCPGPEEIPLTNDVVLVIMDSQWWLHEFTKPGIESDCLYKTKSEVMIQLKDILDRNFRKLVVLAMHHPLRTFGSHGSYYAPKQWFFPFTEMNKYLWIPFPPISFIYPFVRKYFGTPQDLKHPLYQEMIASIENELKGHPNVVLVAGHEHSLQFIQDSGRTFIVSGSGSKAYRVSKPKISLYAKSEFGFATLDISTTRNVTAHFYTVNKNTGAIDKNFSHDVLNFSKLPPEEKPDTARIVEAVFKDSAVISASDRYKNPSGIKRLVLGENYRKAWSTPINLKVFNMHKEKGGLIPVSVGGGKQTKSLTLKEIGPNGKEWVLRSVDKDPELAIPETLQGTLAEDIVKDLTSGTHPYAALVVADLAKSTGIFAADPQLYYVPDDPAFGFYRPMFKGSVCFLEEKQPLMANATTTRSTHKVISKMIEDPDHHTDQPEFLRSRLLDMVIGDWERHPDQWRWDVLDTGKGKLYYPVPRDRDQAFFNSEGLLMRYVRKNKLRYLQGFRHGIPNINWLNYSARDIDRIFLNSLDSKAWSSTIKSFTTDLTDSVIHKAALKLPAPVYPIDGPDIEDKLRHRRNILMDKVMQYYRILSKVVTVTGSNEREYFKLSQNGDSLKVKVFKRTAKNDSASLMYQRSFDAHTTKEIRLYGLNGNDIFDVDDAVKSKIKVRIIGGRGNDTFNVRGSLPNRLYDLKTEKNFVMNSHHSRVKFSNEIVVNEYSPTGFNYDDQKFPKLLLGYNVEDKMLVGVGYSRRNYGFRKLPFASDNNISLLYALNRGAYKLKYNGIFNNVIGHTDVLVNAELVNPTLNNFFGIGNTTERDKQKNPEFNRVRYKYTQLEVLLRRKRSEYLYTAVGPMLYHYWNKPDDNKTRVLEHPAAIGLDSASVYSLKTYIGGKASLYFNFVNNEIFPTRGLIINAEAQALAGANHNSKGFTKVYGDMMIPIPIVGPTTLYLILKMGGGHIFSKNYEYFQAFNLGANNNLRGYRKNRFYGSSLAFSSLDFRLKLFKSKSYILPGDVGLTGLFDFARVWAKHQPDRGIWHTSYGGGIYITPFNLAVVAATVGFSKEDHLFNFSLGTKFNLTF